MLFLSTLMAAVYGILHDHLTYSICPEYYTKFKFYQFRLVYLPDTVLPEPRLYVTIVGMMATWWIGLLIGLIQGLVGFIHKDQKTMFRLVFKSVLITLCVAIIFAAFGYLAGKFFISDPSWRFPENLIDKPSFITVGSIHNFSYLGGLIGLLSGVFFQIIFYRREAKKQRLF